MQKKLRIAAGLAVATLLLGGAGSIAFANAYGGPVPRGPLLIQGPSNGPGTPGVPDAPEPGDIPDVADGPDVPGTPDLPEPGDTPDAPPPAAPR